MRQALQEYRRMKSPFELVGDRVGAVAAASIAAASVHLNPRNGPAGCGLWRLCRRLGCDGDVFPLLRSAGISGSEALRCGSQSSPSVRPGVFYVVFVLNVKCTLRSFVPRVHDVRRQKREICLAKAPPYTMRHEYITP